MTRTRLSSKGQVVLPKDVRDELGWSAGDELVVELHRDGVLLREPGAGRSGDVEALLGCTGYRGPRRSLHDMERAIRKGARRRR